MGLLKSVGKATGKTFGKVFGTVVTAPSNLILKGIGKITDKEYKTMTADEFVGTKFGKALTITAGVVSGGLLVASGGVTAIGKGIVKAIPKSIGGKVILGTAVVTTAGVLKSSPKAETFVEKTIEGIPDKPKQIYEFGEKVGKVIEGETEFQKSDLGKAVTTAGVVGAVVGAGALIIPRVIDKEKEVKEKVLEIPKQDVPILDKPIVSEKPLNQAIGGETPVLPETSTISTGKTSYKRRRAKKPPQVRQSVNIKLNNTGVRITKKYLNYF